MKYMARRIEAIISDLLAYGTDLITIYCGPQMIIIETEPEKSTTDFSQAIRI